MGVSFIPINFTWAELWVEIAGWRESVTRHCGMGSAGPALAPGPGQPLRGPGRMRRCHVSLLRLVLGHGCCLASVASGNPTCCWPMLATGHGNADVGGSQAPLARHQPGPGPGLQISPDLPDWCTVVPYAGQGRTAGWHSGARKVPGERGVTR